MKNLVDRLKRFGLISIELSLGVFMVGMLVSAAQAKANPVDPPTAVVSASSAVLPIPGTSCLRNNTTGSVLTWDNTTGAYTFSTCTGFTLSGTGVVTCQNSIVLLSDRKPDRNVSAGFNTGQKTGSATIYFLVAPGSYQVFRIYDTTSFGNVCSCP